MGSGLPDTVVSFGLIASSYSGGRNHTSSWASDFNVSTVDIHLSALIVLKNVQMLRAQQIFSRWRGLGDREVQL